MKLHFSELRRSGNVPRVHPNGFIQLDLAPHWQHIMDCTRLHVWSNVHDIAHQRTSHPIHDHRFDMTSRVLVGGLVNKIYGEVINKTGPFVEHRAAYKTRHDATLANTGKRFNVLRVLTQVVLVGQTYTVPAARLHTTDPIEHYDYVVTVINSSKPKPQQPVRVMVPYGVKVDNEFNRHTSNSRERLWEIIEQALMYREEVIKKQA